MGSEQKTHEFFTSTPITPQLVSREVYRTGVTLGDTFDLAGGCCCVLVAVPPLPCRGIGTQRRRRSFDEKLPWLFRAGMRNEKANFIVRSFACDELSPVVYPCLSIRHGFPVTEGAQRVVHDIGRHVQRRHEHRNEQDPETVSHNLPPVNVVPKQYSRLVSVSSLVDGVITD